MLVIDGWKFGQQSMNWTHIQPCATAFFFYTEFDLQNGLVETFCLDQPVVAVVQCIQTVVHLYKMYYSATSWWTYINVAFPYITCIKTVTHSQKND